MLLDRRKIRDHRGHHPWRTMGLLSEWRVEFVNHLDPSTRGLTLFAERRILVADDLPVEDRRSTICHETGHALRGPCIAAQELYEESLVERQAARLLMPSVRRIGHALAWHRGDYADTARDMWVDEMLLNARLSTLAPAERTWLDEQLDTILI